MKNKFAGLLLLVGLFACQKKETAPATTLEILTSTKWQIYSLTVANPPNSTPGDITTTTFKACELDDVIEFTKAGAFSVNEHTDVCLPGTNRSIFAKLNGAAWVLSGPDTLVTLKAGFLEQAYRIGQKSLSFIELYQIQKNYLDEYQKYTYTLRAVE